MAIIYKIVPQDLWAIAVAEGFFKGAPVDLADGFIHFSDAGTVAETAARHFAGLNGLLLVAIEEERLVPHLKWEVSRGGKLFPHLFAPLNLADVLWVKPLPLGPDGLHIFPDLVSIAK